MGNKLQNDFKVKVVPQKRVLSKPKKDSFNNIAQNTLNHIQNMSVENILQLQAYNKRRLTELNSALTNQKTKGLKTIQ
jgi:hypothetical protein